MDRLTESMFQNKRIKLFFFLGVVLIMRFVGVSWWNAITLALFAVLVGGVILFFIEDVRSHS